VWNWGSERRVGDENRMKNNLIFIFLLFIFFLNSFCTSSCQYTEDIKENRTFFYDEDIRLDYTLVEFIGFKQGSSDLRGGTNTDAQFKVKNNHPSKKINLKVTFTKNGGLDSENVSVDPLGYTLVSRTTDDRIDFSSIKYKFLDKDFSIKSEEVKINTSCKICQGGAICWDDDTLCNPLYDDSKCGSGICNIAGFCGKTKIVDCPNGKLNCQDKICLEPSTKDFNEGYRCDFECKYGGREEKCLENPFLIQNRKDSTKKKWVIFGAIIILITSFGFWDFAVHKRKREEKKRDGVREEVSNLKKQKEDFEKGLAQLKRKEDNHKLKLKDIKKEIQKLEKKRGDLQREINSLKEKMKNSKGEIRQKYKKEIIRLKRDYKQTKNDIRNKQNDIILQNNKLIKDEREFETKNEDYWRKKSLEDSGQRDNLTFNEKGYLVFKNNPKNLFHWWLYKTYLDRRGEKLPSNYSIHHIDRNKLNNSMWNLLPLDKNIHDIKKGENLTGKFDHNLIQIYNWDSGIQQLKEQLGMREKDFPEHIQKEIRKRKEQRKLILTSNQPPKTTPLFPKYYNSKRF
jgi:hypothetical protein